MCRHSNVAQPSKFDKRIRASFELCPAPGLVGESAGAGKGALAAYEGACWLALKRSTDSFRWPHCPGSGKNGLVSETAD